MFKGSDSEKWFAAAPPIALLALFLKTVSGPNKKALMVCDVSRVFFYAPVQSDIFVELREEAKKTVEDNIMCAKLRMSMLCDQGSRSKLAKVQESMATLGFSIGNASPDQFCVSREV